MRLPDNSQRIVIVGRTGSGKTQAGIWHLSRKKWGEFPWVIFNWKGDPLIAQLPAKPILLTDKIQEPGLYVVAPRPDEQAEVESFLWSLWERGNVGVYIDEGYMLDKSQAFRAIQTQGRSKQVPTITLSQRPVFMDRFVFSEADFYQVFTLNDKNDRQRISEWMPKETDNYVEYNANLKLPKYHSWYYDVGDNELAVLSPVPEAKEIIASFYPSPEEQELTQLTQSRIRLL